MDNPETQRGFTLVEVLVALSITAFVSVIAYTSLSSVMTGVEAMRDSTRRTYELNRAMMILSRDFSEFVARPVRDEFGDVEYPIVGGPAARFMLSLTRSGWHNPNSHPRSNLQRINYRLENEGLWRDSYSVLDRAGDTEPQTVLLLDGVEYMELAFLGSLSSLEQSRSTDDLDTDDWVESWVDGSSLNNPGASTPVAITNVGNTTSNYTLPVAVELRMQLAGWGEIRRLYVLPPF